MTRKIFERKIKKNIKSLLITGNKIRSDTGIKYFMYYNNKVIIATVKYEKKRYILTIKDFGWLEFKTERKLYDFLYKLILKPNDIKLVKKNNNNSLNILIEVSIITLLILLYFFHIYN